MQQRQMCAIRYCSLSLGLDHLLDGLPRLGRCLFYQGAEFGLFVRFKGGIVSAVQL
jgi:hypothetical protein